MSDFESTSINMEAKEAETKLENAGMTENMSNPNANALSHNAVAESTTTHVESKLRIALISTPLLTAPPKTYGGLELIVANLGRELARMGHEVTIFAPIGSLVHGCNIREFTPQRIPPAFAEWLQFEAKAYEMIEKELDSFDIIHGHNWFGQEYRAKVRNPSLHVCHTHHGGILADWAKNRPFKLNTFAISDWMREKYEGSGIPARRVYNGVDLSKFPMQRKKSDRFLWLSRIAFFKAPHKAIEIAKKTGVKLDIAGATCFAEDAKYIEQIKKDCDGKQIRFIGEVTHEQKLSLMQNAKALIVSARWGEPFGLHVIETMATGTGVIAMADGGIKETVKRGGILCNDEYELANAVKNYSPIEPRICRHNASRFSSVVMARNYVKAYREILDGAEW